jgi:hypothetical protein
MTKKGARHRTFKGCDRQEAGIGTTRRKRQFGLAEWGAC